MLSCLLLTDDCDILNRNPKMTSIRERARLTNTLACLLKGLIGYRTIVELRNDTKIYGLVECVDSCMNLTMSDVIFSKPSGHQMACDVFYVLGKNIRFVHIPDEIDIVETIRRQLQLFSTVRNNNKERERARGRKLKQKEKIEKAVERMKSNIGEPPLSSEHSTN